MFLFLRLKNGFVFDPWIQEYYTGSGFTLLGVGINMFLKGWTPIHYNDCIVEEGANGISSWSSCSRTNYCLGILTITYPSHRHLYRQLCCPSRHRHGHCCRHHPPLSSSPSLSWTVARHAGAIVIVIIDAAPLSLSLLLSSSSSSLVARRHCHCHRIL